MDTLTKQLKASITYEQSKTDLTNLLNHNEPDLLLLIDAIEFQMRDYDLERRMKERMIEESEDLSERVRANLNDSIAWLKSRVQSLLAWRAIYFSAIETIKE